MIERVTVILITYNEVENIIRTIPALNRFKNTIVIDSFSDDGTLEICRSFENVTIVQRRFDSFAEQCNFALEQVEAEWVLSLDADYVLSDRLVEEIASLSADAECSGYSARFSYCIHGRKLRGSLYPPRTVLYRRALARYENEGHGHRVKVSGEIRSLQGVIYHDDRKPLRRWFASQITYAEKEASHLLSSDRASLPFVDRIRLMSWPAPFFVFFYVLFARGCIFDGPAGWFYAFQRVVAELLLALELIDRRLRR